MQRGHGAVIEAQDAADRRDAHEWNRKDAMDFAAVMVEHIVPPYRAPMESYDKAQSVQKVGRGTRLEHLTPARA
jgi:hypothetical protein